MTLENARKIVAYLANHGVDASVDEGYSGRGMYGRTTAAVRADNAGSVSLAMSILKIDDSERVDSLGMGVVVY